MTHGLCGNVNVKSTFFYQESLHTSKLILCKGKVNYLIKTYYITGQTAH